MKQSAIQSDAKNVDMEGVPTRNRSRRSKGTTFVTPLSFLRVLVAAKRSPVVGTFSVQADSVKTAIAFLDSYAADEVGAPIFPLQPSFALHPRVVIESTVNSGAEKIDSTTVQRNSRWGTAKLLAYIIVPRAPLTSVPPSMKEVILSIDYE